MRVTQSSLREYTRCGRKWWFSQYRGLRRRDEYRSPLSVGNLVHAGLAEYYAASADPLAVVRRMTADLLAANPDRERQIIKDAELATVMVEGYLEWLEETGADLELEVTEPERELTVHLVDGITLQGKLDVKVRDRHGWTAFLEHKTVGNFTDLPAIAQRDRQLLTYHLLEMLQYLEDETRQRKVPRDLARAQSTEALAVLVLPEPDHTERRHLDGASPRRESDEQRSVESDGDASRMSQYAPQQGAQEKAIYQGASSSTQFGDAGEGTRTNRGNEDEDWTSGQGTLGSDDPGSTIRFRGQDLPSPKTSGAILNMLRKVKRTAAAKPPFYQRHEVRHNLDEIRNHWRHTVAVARQVERTRALLDAGADHHVVVPPVPTMNCRWECPFNDVCGMMDDNSDVEPVIELLYEVVDPLERYQAEAR